jgi:parallel beta-helix repeat protein
VRPFTVLALALVALASSGCAVGITGQPTSTAGTTAVVGGAVVTTTGQQVEFWAEYGLTSAYGSSSEHHTTTLGTDGPQAVERELTGLTRGTTYHYRLCARDSDQPGGPRCGDDATVTTTNVDCGDVITQDLVLSGSLSCRDLDTPGLVVGADGVDIDLDGHELSGALCCSNHGEGAAGIRNDGYDDVSVHHGTVSRFGYGVILTNASFNRVHDLEVRAYGGLTINGGEGNRIRRYRLTEIGRGGYTLAAFSNQLDVADSSGPIWSVQGERAHVARNDIGGELDIYWKSACLRISGNNGRVADNRVGGCRDGGIVVASGAGNSLLRNEVSWSVLYPGLDGDPDGIRVDPFTAGTLLRDNYSHDNQDDGIEVLAHDARLEGNRAENNGGFGIDAVSGVTDLGGNTASGNGKSPQCRNVLCP